MIAFYSGNGWLMTGPLLPGGVPTVGIQVIQEGSGPLFLKKDWIPLGDPYWSRVKQISLKEVDQGLRERWGIRWKQHIADEMMNLISDGLCDSEEGKEYYFDSLDEVVAWVIGCPRVVTVKEAEERWRVSGLRSRIRDKAFDSLECWQSGKTWMLRISGMYRRYGWPDEP